MAKPWASSVLKTEAAHPQADNAKPWCMPYATSCRFFSPPEHQDHSQFDCIGDLDDLLVVDII
jgi:hypothetical protein